MLAINHRHVIHSHLGNQVEVFYEVYILKLCTHSLRAILDIEYDLFIAASCDVIS
jgi:hypothetical protein